MSGLSLTPFRQLPAEFRSALQAFTSSSSTFRILRTVRSDHASSSPSSSSTPTSAPSSPPDHLFILDSSFNPPTLGHQAIALSALRSEPAEGSASTDQEPKPRHLLLLLATQNADKAPKPAPFEQRLVMMSIMAEQLVASLRASPPSSTTATTTATGTPSSSSTSAAEPSSQRPAPPISVSVGVTKHPYFIDKSNSIAREPASPFPYPPTHQTHLIGFDTFTRLLDPRYYGPAHKLTPLEPLFENHAVRVTLRAGDEFGDRRAQERYVEDLADGRRDDQGARREWARKIALVEGRNDEVVTSSTRAREAAARGDREGVSGMCGDLMADWVLGEGLYKEA